MKYIRGFFTFWRHFILGDDSTIAILVMWSLLFTWSLTSYFMNIWIVVPVSVVIVLLTLCYDQTARRPLLHGRSELLRFMLATTIPFILVVALPSMVFRFVNHAVNFHYVVQPLAICLITATFLSIVLYEIYKKFPAFVVFIFGVVAFATIWF